MSELRETPLREVHEAHGAKMVPFAGFRMPVMYGSIIKEHNAVREGVGLFDVSHMGEFLVTGPNAKALVNDLVTNDVNRLEPGGLQYTVMSREDGTVVDDLLVFLVDDERIILVVNAANIDKDLAHVRTFARDGADVSDVSDDYALIAVQGPKALETMLATPVLAGVTDQLRATDYYHGFAFDVDGEEAFVTRTGYTGEIGFEVFVPPAMAVRVWNQLMEAGAPYGVAPIGLGARDTLRFEAAYCLYGHELDDNTSPLEAGLGWVVKLKKDGFSGRATLKAQKKDGPPRALIGLELEGRNIARQGYSVLKGDRVVGAVTSGAFSPTLKKSLCMALIERSATKEEGDYFIEIRNKIVPAQLTPLPFYKSRVK